MFRLALCAVLVAANLVVVLQAYPNYQLSVLFLDVGQGDAILIESPTGVQMLVDGGADSSVMRELGRKLSFFDRSIDIVVATHPDKDHIGGLADVFARYDVSLFLEPGIENDTSAALALERAATAEPELSRIDARRGMRILLGGGAYADVLFPDRDVSGVETNLGSVVLRVVLGDHEFLLTGDSPKSIEKYLVLINEGELESDVLKVGHHGSKTSTTEEFVETVSPTYAVISAGKDNSYGHPHEEVLNILADKRVRPLATFDSGTITFQSDGVALEIVD